MSDSLFRQQALAIRNDRLGHVVPWSMPRTPLWGSLLGAWLIIAVALLAQLNYADKISVAGAVQPSELPVAVVSTTTGTVKAVYVEELQDVPAGEALLLINKRTHVRNGKPSTLLRIDQLLAQQLALRDERRRYRALRKQERSVLDHRTAGLLAQRRTVKEHLDVLEQRVALAQVDRQKVARLADQDWLSENDLNRSLGTLLAAHEARLEQQRRLQALQLESDLLRSTKRVQATETERRLADIGAQLIQIEHEIARVSASSEELILAPIAGHVVNLLVHEGKQLAPGTPLLTISPPVAALHHVEVYLPSTAAGRVRTGMQVRLRYSGYPFAEYGAGSGVVASVSEVNSKTGAQPLFRAEVTVLELPAGIDHTPAGMSVNADILFTARPLWMWFVHPLRAAFSRL